MKKMKVVVVENSYALLLYFGQASGILEIGQNCIFYGIGNGFGLLWIRRISFICKRFWFIGNRQNFVFLFFGKVLGLLGIGRIELFLRNLLVSRNGHYCILLKRILLFGIGLIMKWVVNCENTNEYENVTVAVAPENDFRGFNGNRTRGLCVRAAVLYQLSYEDPYTGGRPIYWLVSPLKTENWWHEVLVLLFFGQSAQSSLNVHMRLASKLTGSTCLAQ